MGIARKSNARILRDVAYSTAAYALPTFALYFIIQPLIARHISGAENGLFLTLLSLVRFCCNILISPLANLRLLEKQSVIDDHRVEEHFNYHLFLATGIGVIVACFVGIIYLPSFRILDIILSLLFTVLLFFHDYYSIKFRIDINFKKVVYDNLLIVVGFFIGLYFFWISCYWQFIFICGYLLGSVYVLFESRDMWNARFHNHRMRNVTRRYCELSTSSGLNKAVVYCDKLLIYPILGGVAVSTYNAASVVSKVISLISVPLRNVLLSYMVDRSVLAIPRRTMKTISLAMPCLLLIIYAVFSAISFLLCKFLYPMFYGEASKFIYVIVATILIETVAGLLNLILLKYRSLSIQTYFSAIKLACYLLSVFVLTILMDGGLWGFCIATLITTMVNFVLVFIFSRRCIIIE